MVVVEVRAVVVAVSVADAAVAVLTRPGAVADDSILPDGEEAEAAAALGTIMATITVIGGETTTDPPIGVGMTEETMIDTKDVIGRGIEFKFITLLKSEF